MNTKPKFITFISIKIINFFIYIYNFLINNLRNYSYIFINYYSRHFYKFGVDFLDKLIFSLSSLQFSLFSPFLQPDIAFTLISIFPWLPLFFCIVSTFFCAFVTIVLLYSLPIYFLCLFFRHFFVCFLPIFSMLLQYLGNFFIMLDP